MNDPVQAVGGLHSQQGLEAVGILVRQVDVVEDSRPQVEHAVDVATLERMMVRFIHSEGLGQVESRCLHISEFEYQILPGSAKR